MSLTVNPYYTGANGSARAFAEEMEKSGLADAVRAEEGVERYAALEEDKAGAAFIRK